METFVSAMPSTHITSNNDGKVDRSESMPTVTVFSTSQFFPAKDGTWLMVDYMSDGSDWYSWYVIESK